MINIVVAAVGYALCFWGTRNLDFWDFSIAWIGIFLIEFAVSMTNIKQYR